jgi:hypothetical protein
MFAVADRLAEVLAAQPGRVLPSGSIAARRPASAAELPAIAISVEATRADELGLGRLVRGSELLADGARMREDVLGERFGGTLELTVWAADAAAAESLARAAAAKLHAARAALRERGFAVLRPVALHAMERLRPEPAGAPFTPWSQRLAYRFTFDLVEGGIVAGGGVIRRIDVDTDEATEAFSVPDSS